MSVPIYSMSKFPDLLSDETEARRKSLDASAEADQVYNFMLDSWRRCRPQPLFAQELNVEQVEYFDVIRTKADWQEVEREGTFAAEVDLYQYITLDIEDFLPDHAALKQIPVAKQRREQQQRPVYAMFSTITGRTVSFDLESFCGGPVKVADPFEHMPTDILGWLDSAEIMVAGASIRKDIETLRRTVRRAVDTNVVFEYAMQQLGKYEPLVQLGCSTRTGKGQQAFYGKGLDHRPMLPANFLRLYGPHGYEESCVREWPEWRRPVKLYKWQKINNELNMGAKFFQFMESTTPTSLAARLFLDSRWRGRFPLINTIPDAIAAVMNPAFDVVYDDLVDMEVSAEDVSMMTEGSAQDATGGEGMEVDLVSTKYLKLKKSSDIMVCFVSPMQGATAKKPKLELEEGEISEPSARKNELKPSFGYFDAETERHNFYVPQPSLGRVCHYCGKPGHSLRSQDGVVMCDAYLRDDKEIPKCRYPKCLNNTTHRTPACPTMHHRCEICHFRGHEESSGCWRWSERDWEDAKRTFEDTADAGVLTGRRRREERYGFWGHIKGSPFPYFDTYERLLGMPPLYVAEMLGIRPPQRSPPPPPPPRGRGRGMSHRLGGPRPPPPPGRGRGRGRRY